MASVMIKCPNTGEAVSTGIAMDQAAFESSTLQENALGGCPACGGTHVWNKEDAFLADD